MVALAYETDFPALAVAQRVGAGFRSPRAARTAVVGRRRGIRPRDGPILARTSTAVTVATRRAGPGGSRLGSCGRNYRLGRSHGHYLLGPPAVGWARPGPGRRL